MTINNEIMEIQEKTKLKSLDERFSSFNELAAFVNNGRITFHKSGNISFFKNDYIIKVDTEMFHTGYGYKAEDDARLSRRGVERKKVFKKGHTVRLTFDMYGDYLHFCVLATDGKNESYRSFVSMTINNEQYWKMAADNVKLFPENHPDFNCISNFYCWVKNGKIELTA